MAKLRELVLAAALGLGVSFNAQADEYGFDLNKSDDFANHLLLDADPAQCKADEQGRITLYNEKGFKVMEDGRKLFDSDRGNLVFYHEDGQVKEEIIYFQGKPQGTSITYHPNGQIKTKGNYVAGKKEGVWFTWYNNGQLQWFENYYHGKRHGTQMMWAKNGKLSLEQNMIQGNLHGRYVEWNSNGSGTIENYVDGKRHGERVWFDGKGTITSRYFYIRDNPQE